MKVKKLNLFCNFICDSQKLQIALMHKIAHYGHKINLFKALKLMHLWNLPLRHKLLFLIFIVTLMIRHAKGDFIKESCSFPLTKYDGTFFSPKFAIATNLIKQFYIAN